MGDELAGSMDMPFGADYNGADAVAASGSLWDSLNVNDVFSKLIGAGVTRAAYEINKPLYNAAEKQRSPDGLLGKIGTVGLSSDTKSLVILVLVIAAAVYLFPKFMK